MLQKTSFALIAGCGLALAILAGQCTPAAAADPDVLWKIVHTQCVPNQEASNQPKPCTYLDNPEAAGGYAVLKDLNGATQFLLIPTTKITGIEDTGLEAADAPDFFDDAWQARRFVDAVVPGKLGRGDFSLAINSINGRSQNQLHIHVDCIRADVRDELRTEADKIGATWAPLATAFDRHKYMAMRLDQDSLAGVNVFKLVSDTLAIPPSSMGLETIVVVGETSADGKNGFYVLADHSDGTLTDTGSAEELQDHTCAIAK